MNAQILIQNGNDWFEFSMSKTGQLDYEGKWEYDALPDFQDYQKISSSTYFSPSWYVFIQDKLNFNPKLFVAPDVDVSEKATFDYLVHVGALIAAVQAKDSLLAGELFLRRREVFERFAQLTQYIMEPLCVEVLFSLCYGKMQNVDPESIPLILESAKEKLDYDSSSETLDQAFIRWFKKNNVTLTLPLVGTDFYDWDAEPYSLEKLSYNLNCDDLLGMAQKIRRAKHSFYESLETVVQAEPYNRYDKNSILVCIEGTEKKLAGNAGLEKAGHIRALAAKIIREAKPKKMSYASKLCSLGNNKIVVEVTV
ncbi:MAG: hypothetical protein J6Y16_10875 [Treponema sp.]|nr:hypothetical protein [Treponema sp.]